jgi:hypothetical protein
VRRDWWTLIESTNQQLLSLIVCSIKGNYSRAMENRTQRLQIVIWEGFLNQLIFEYIVERRLGANQALFIKANEMSSICKGLGNPRE